MSQPIKSYLSEIDLYERNLRDEACEPTRDDYFAAGAEIEDSTVNAIEETKSVNSEVFANGIKCNNCQVYLDFIKPNSFFKLDCGHYLCKTATCLDATFFSTTCQLCGLPVHREALLSCVIFVVKKFKHDSEVEEILDIGKIHSIDMKNRCDKLRDMANKMKNLQKTIETARASILSLYKPGGLLTPEILKAFEAIKYYDENCRKINQLLLHAFEPAEAVEIGTRLTKVSNLVLDKKKIEELQENPQNIVAIMKNHDVLKFCRLTVDEGLIFLHAAQTGQILQPFTLEIDYENLKNHEKYGFFLIIEIEGELHLLKYRFLVGTLLTKQVASLFLGLTECCYKNVKIRKAADYLVIPEYVDQADNSLRTDDILFGIPDRDGVPKKVCKIGSVFSLRKAFTGAQLCISASRCADLPNCIAEVVGENSENVFNGINDHCKILDCGIILKPKTMLILKGKYNIPSS